MLEEEMYFIDHGASVPDHASQCAIQQDDWDPPCFFPL